MGGHACLLGLLALAVLPAAHVSAFLQTGSLPRLAPRGGALPASISLQAKTFSPNDFGLNIASPSQAQGNFGKVWFGKQVGADRLDACGSPSFVVLGFSGQQ